MPRTGIAIDAGISMESESMKRILVAADGSEGSDRAVDYAAKLARALGAGLVIVNVIGGHDLPEKVFSRFTRAQTAWFDELLETNSADVLTKAKERARSLGASQVEIESRKGNVVHSLIEVAEDHSVDAIVVGKHGHGALVSALLGSVAHKLVTLSKWPVIVAP